jgi:short-subunit dehydrogenase
VKGRIERESLCRDGFDKVLAFHHHNGHHPGDLAQPKTPTEIFAFTQERGITVGLLVNNADVGSYGAFRASDRERELGIIQLNCSALVHLTHLYLLDMVERRSGAILTVSSLRHTRVCPTWPPTPQAKGSAYSSPRR